MENSRIKNVSKNMINVVFFQIVKILLVFVGRIIFLKVLDSSFLGVNGLFSNILTVLTLTDLGINTSLMYSLYKPLANNDEKKVAQYINYFKKIYNTIALVIAILGVLLIPFLKYLVNLPNDMEHIYLYYLLLLLNSVTSYLFVYKTTLLSADQKMYIINRYDILFQFILFASQTLVLIFTHSFALYLLCTVICTVLSNYFKVRKTEQLYPYLKTKDYDSLPKNDRKNIFMDLKSLFLYKLGGVIQSNTDNILISIFVGTITVGYYSNYSLIILSVTSFLTIFFTSIKASLGNYITNKDKKNQLKMFNILETYNFWLVGFCAICFLILIPDFISICFGENYLLSHSVLIWIVLNFYTSNIRQTIWAYRETTGLFSKTKYITLTTSTINLFLSILLGYYYGIAGIIAATVIARMLFAWWREPQILFKDYFNSSAKTYYCRYIGRLLLLTVTYFLIYFACLLPNINIYIDFILKIIILILIFGLMIIIVYRKSDAMSYFKNNILKKVGGKFYERLFKDKTDSKK